MRAPEFPRFQVVPISKSSSIPVQVFDAYLRSFHTVISPVDGARSAMYPTGSAYARQAFAKHGALLAFVLRAERLCTRATSGSWRHAFANTADGEYTTHWRPTTGHKPGPAGIGDSQ
jgi:putative component of membrane protein insertase Oxa1/YidC/SpoIIIJ protein YidD